jgi:hypothetical protein
MKSLPLAWRRAGLLLGLFVLVLLVMDFNARLEAVARQEGQVSTARARATEVFATHQALEVLVTRAASDEAVEGWAYQDGGMARPGDHPVVPVADPHSTPPAAAGAPPTSVPPTNWQVWWELFFGD